MAESCYGQGTVEEGNTSTGNAFGMQFFDGSNPVGESITGCKFYCRTLNTGTDNELYAQIWDDDNNVKATSTNSVNNNTLSGSTFTEMSFTFDGTYTLQDTDIIGIKNTNSSGNLRPAQEGSMSAGQNPAFIEATGDPLVWGDETDTIQFKSCVSYDEAPPPTSTGTRLPPPPLRAWLE